MTGKARPSRQTAGLIAASPRTPHRDKGPAFARAAAALLFCCLATTTLAQQPAVTPNRGAHPEALVLDKAQLERRMASVGYLLEKSTSAQQIAASGDAGAKKHLDRAQESYRLAKQAFAAEDYAGATRLLAEASSLVMEGARHAAPDQVTGEKERAAFDARLSSVTMLLAADERIHGEKQATPEAAAASRAAGRMIAEAKELAAAGKLAEGRAVLDRAYLMARAGVSSLRSGDTLTRSVNFASKEEEYRYEAERNDTHRALLQSLLEQRHTPPEGMLKQFIDDATQLRKQAGHAAATGDHAAAVSQLEESTRNLLRAIRSLGISVPG